MFRYAIEDVDHSPMLVFYEVTRACDLTCRHCRACAMDQAHPNELTSEQSREMIDQLLTFPSPPMLVVTGGDPMKRADTLDMVRYATGQGLTTSMVPSATPLLTEEVVGQLKDAGLARLGVSIDGPNASIHDKLRGFGGTFDRALSILDAARNVGLPTQVNTVIASHNVNDIDAMADLMGTLGITLWSVFFLVPVGRAVHSPRIEPKQYAQVFERLFHHSQHQPYAIKTTEAPFYRRYVLQHQGDPQRGEMRAPLGINDGKGILFVSHVGDVCPSGFLPINTGRYPKDSIVDLYQNHPVFRELRDPDLLRGKCGYCDYRQVCGGSRARAKAVCGSHLDSEPDCAYLPPDPPNSNPEPQRSPQPCSA